MSPSRIAPEAQLTSYLIESTLPIFSDFPKLESTAESRNTDLKSLVFGLYN